MKISPTASFLRQVKGSAVVGTWSVYLRTVTDISLSLTSGTWTDVSDRLDEIPPIHSAIEYEAGQFQTDSVELTFDDPAWWTTNIFTDAVIADSTKYVEFKILYSVLGASDSIPVFFGFADKDSIQYDEIENTVAVTILTPQDIGFRKAAENLTTRYLVRKIDGTNDGLAMLNVPGVYVMDAAIASFNLKLGAHRIFHQWDGFTRQLKLDDGEWVTVTAIGDYTLVNEDLDQKVKVHIPDLAKVTGNQVERVDDEIVVVNPGQTIPWQWYDHVGLKNLLTKYFTSIGITSVTFDDLTMNTRDGARKVSFIDNPPNDETISGEKYAIEADVAGNVWVAIGNLLYRRDRTAETYALKATLAANDVVLRMIYSYRSGDHEDLWLFILNGSTVKMRLYEIDNNVLRDAVTLTTAGTDSVNPASIAVVDYNYTGASYKYALCYTVKATGSDNGFFRTVTKSGGSLLVITTLFTDTFDPEPNGYGHMSIFMYVKSGNLIRFIGFHQASPDASAYEEVTINGSGTFVQNPIVIINANLETSSIAAYHTVDDRVYYYSSLYHRVRSHPAGTFSLSDNGDLDIDPVEDAGRMFYGGGKVWFTTIKNRSSLYPFDDNFLWSITGNGTRTQESNGPMCDWFGMAWNGLDGLLVGISRNGLLWQHHTKLVFYVRRASFPNQTATDAIYSILASFNLVATIGGGKSAFVFRRGDEIGDRVSTGQVLSLGDEDVESVSSDKFKYPKTHLIRVAGFSRENSYDGTDYGTSVLSDKKVIELSSKVIPDELVEDVLYYLYQFYSTAKPVVIHRVGYPYFHFECFDEVNPATSSPVDDSAAGNGVIYGITYFQDGSMEVESMLFG